MEGTLTGQRFLRINSKDAYDERDSQVEQFVLVKETFVLLHLALDVAYSALIVRTRSSLLNGPADTTKGDRS